MKAITKSFERISRAKLAVKLGGPPKSWRIKHSDRNGFPQFARVCNIIQSMTADTRLTKAVIKT